MAFDKGALVIYKRTDILNDKMELVEIKRDETRIDATTILKVLKP